MSENKLSIIQRLEATAPVQIPNIPQVAERFKALYITFNGKGAENFYEAEKFHFAKMIQDSAELQACTKLSLYGCFLDMAVSGLSFDPSYNHVFMYPYNVKTVVNNVEKWEKRAKINITGTGELLLRMQQGQIKYADNPVLVFEGDLFKMGTKDNCGYVEHEVTLPRKSDQIIACYIKITRSDGTVDHKILTMPEIDRLRQASKKPDGPAWTKGLFGMVQTKTIKHAFRNYPKLRILGRASFTELSSEIIDEIPEVIKLQPDTIVPATPETVDVIHVEDDFAAVEEKPESEDFTQVKAEPQTGLTFDDENF